MQLIGGLGFTFISFIFLFGFLFAQFFDISRAKRIIKNGSFFVIEGPIENYHPMPKEGHEMERFDISGVHFEYSDYQGGLGYHNAASLGGVIAPNNYYRVTYCRLHENEDTNRILKIEIRQ